MNKLAGFRGCLQEIAKEDCETKWLPTAVKSKRRRNCCGIQSSISNSQECIECPYNMVCSGHSGRWEVSSTGMARSTRKKKRTPATWQKKKLKGMVTQGRAHISSSGSKKLIRAKIVKPGCTASCRLGCGYKLTDEVKEELHKTFYQLPTRDHQQSFIVSSVSRSSPKRTTVQDDQQRKKERGNTFIYHVTVKGEAIRVCKTTFQAMFDLSDGRIARAMKGSLQNQGAAAPDKRGKSTTSRVSIEARERVKTHIESFPNAPSHYSRRSNPDVRYLSGDLNIRKMYELYVVKCNEEGTDAVKESFYRSVFCEDYNLKFVSPKSDTCDTCDRLRTEIQAAGSDEAEKTRLTTTLKLHQVRAELGYKALRDDTERAKVDPKFACICFDLQQALPTPSLTAGVVFYKRQLYTYNFCIHNAATSKGTMYMWSEDIAGRGSEEMASCVSAYIEDLVNGTEVEEIVMYSDSCGGQNKNFTMLSLMHLLVASAGGSLKLTHKFLVPGHTFLPCDRSFGVIDRARRHAMNIFVPEDWCHLVETCRRQNPFKVIRMKQDDFYTFKSVEQCMIKRTTTEDGQKVRFSKAASLEVSQPLKTLVKHSHGSMQPVKVLNHAPKRGKRPNLANSVLQGKYESPNQINPAKKADLVSLLHLIPPVHHGYYRALSTSHKTSAGTGKRGKGGKTTAAKRRSGGRRAAEESECEDFDSSSDSSCTQQV